MKHLKLGQLPWVNVPPYDQLLTDLVNLCLEKDTSLICIQGPSGSGKSRIIAELLSVLALDTTASSIVLDGKNSNMFDENNVVTFTERFIQMVDQKLHDHQHVYVLIDDMDAISSVCLNAMNDLIDRLNTPVTIIFSVGVTALQDEVKTFIQGSKVVIIEGMTVGQTQLFLERVTQDIATDKVFTIKKINQLHGMSYGHVGRLLNLLLEDSEVQRKLQKKYYPFIALICVLLVAVVSFWFLQKSAVAPINLQSEKIEIEEVIPVKVVLPVSSVAEEIVGPAVLAMAAINEIEREEIPVKVLTVVSHEIPLKPRNLLPVKASSENASVVIRESTPLSKIEKIHYVIELSRHQSKKALEGLLQGRSIPGKAQYKQIKEGDKKIWVAYIGPYGNQQQATDGMKKLPASLQSLPLKVKKEL